MKRSSTEADGDVVTKQMKSTASGDCKTGTAPGTSNPLPSQTSQQKPFCIFPLNKYDGNKFPFFKQPREVGFYSLDKDRKLHHDARLRKFFFPPPPDEEISFNLGFGYEEFIRRDDDVKERLDNILTWLVKNKQMFQEPESKG